MYGFDCPVGIKAHAVDADLAVDARFIFQDIIVDSSVFCTKQHFWFALKACEIFVRIGIVGGKTFGPVGGSHGEIYHILSALQVEIPGFALQPSRIVFISVATI